MSRSTSDGLHLGPHVALPLEAVTQPIGILAARGAGKSNTAVCLAEEMYRHGLPFVVLDAPGAWWGLRSAADGKGPGLSIPVLGGEHGDIPLESTGGHVLADLIADTRLSCVIDLSEFSETAKTRFVADFADRLYRKNRDPLHVFIEEADDLAPQRPMREQARSLRALQTLVKRGRFHGLGVTIITQRSAAVNKDLLTQIGTLIAMRTTSPQDRKAILGWVDYHDASKEIVDSLPGLADGEAWLISPQWLKRVERVAFRRRQTFDSGATPVHGEARRATTLADVDLGALQERMAETIERAKSEDPKILRKRIAELERQLASRPTEVERVEVPVEVPVPVLDEATLDRLQDIEGELREARTAIEGGHAELARVFTAIEESGVTITRPRDGKPSVSAERQMVARTIPPPAAPPRVAVEGAPKLGKAERSILSVLAQYPQGRTHSQLCLLAGYSPKASTVGVALSTLRRAGYVTASGLPTITDEGEAVATIEPMPRGHQLLEYWRSHSLLGKAERAVLDILVAEYPREVRQPELCERAGYSPDASTVGVAMSKLRKLELVSGWAASGNFMDAVRA